MHVIPDKPPPPPPLKEQTCVSWCHRSSAPADYSTSYDSERAAVLGMRQAAVPPSPHPLPAQGHPCQLYLSANEASHYTRSESLWSTVFTQQPASAGVSRIMPT